MTKVLILQKFPSYRFFKWNNYIFYSFILDKFATMEILVTEFLNRFSLLFDLGFCCLVVEALRCGLRTCLIAARNFSFLILCLSVARSVMASLFNTWIRKQSDRASIKGDSARPGRAPAAETAAIRTINVMTSFTKFIFKLRFVNEINRKYIWYSNHFDGSFKCFSQSMNFPEHESQYITIRYTTSNFSF